MYLAGSRTFCIQRLLLLCKIILYDFLGIAVRHLQLLTSQHILDGSGKIINVQVVGTHLQQLMANAQPKSIAHFIHTNFL